jgi:hypothetical protein
MSCILKKFKSGLPYCAANLKREKFLFIVQRNSWKRLGKQAGCSRRTRISMSAEPIEYDNFSLPIPPSYEHCVAAPTGLRTNYVVSPHAMAALFAWDEDDD